MRRWNGWGDEGVDFPLSARAVRFLEGLIGPGEPRPAATLADVLAGVRPSRLPAHPLVQTAAETRARHARGQSLPDWVALRSGRIGAFPDGVAFPETADQVRALLRYATEAGAVVIPWGGGTSVVGHVNPLAGPGPVLTVSLARLSRPLRFDETSRLATFGAGISGPDLEAQLRARGFTLGHFPQSFEYSTLGGWIATRSSGQQSLGYGRIERLFAGGRLEAPAGTLELPVQPASAAGPDLREIALGSEGRLGILTEATLRVAPLPPREEFHAAFVPDWQRGLGAARALAQSRVGLSMLRLSDAAETENLLRLAAHPRLVRLLETWVGWRGARAGKCLLLLAATGPARRVRAALAEAFEIVRAERGALVGRALGRQWERSRFRVPYLRNTLWERGYAIDTLETAAPWSRLPALHGALTGVLREGLAASGERVHVSAHVSHVYPDGASLYVTYLFRVAADPEETLARWRALKGAACAAILAGGGTISHHHGVGLDHRDHLRAEKGELGLAALDALCRRFDPERRMNPGKLLADDGNVDAWLA